LIFTEVSIRVKKCCIYKCIDNCMYECIKRRYGYSFFAKWVRPLL